MSARNPSFSPTENGLEAGNHSYYSAPADQPYAYMRRPSAKSPFIRPERAPGPIKSLVRDEARAQAVGTEDPSWQAQMADQYFGSSDKIPNSTWTWAARYATLPFSSAMLAKMNHGKMTELPSQQAWREKVTLCIIIAGMMCCMGFMTFGLKPALCPDDGQDVYTHTFFDPKDHTSVLYNDDVVVFGNIYSFSDMSTLLASTILVNLTADWHGQDLTQLFKPATDLCSDYIKIDPALCSVPNPFPLSLPLQPAKGMPCPSISILSALRPKGRLAFDLSEVISHTAPPHILTAFNGHVLNLTQYFARNKFLSNYTSIETELEYIVGKDGTYGMAQSRDRLKAVMCLQQLYMVGYVQQPTAGCAASFAIVTIVSIIVVGTVMARLVIALMFHCFLSKKMTSKYATSKRGRSQIPDQDKEPYVICMIPCYSEGREGIGGTLESLCNAKYPNAKKLFFLIADGIICGQGNEKPTSEICKELFTIDPELTVEPKSYESNAVGKKKHNMAQVYAGKYKDVPTILVVKCGNKDECEQARQSDIGKVKPGNRGKRDSQLILMKFLSRLEFKDRLTELDYDMYSKIQAVATSPFKYEIILMVDADTVVDSACLGHMIDAMNADPHVMGLCGETQISNKSASWVTSIQVFEYYISHHLGKAFESVFGVVTCLPGCFCMYRIRYRGEAQPVPLIINNHIVSEYAADDVDTLHRKNLLLLGEDRFLTTLLLRMFPKKKMIFVPEATCSTEVPDNFKTLLSQRRRWINSTIHNLFVLMGVKDLCGIFCFSMQFVIALELVGTLILPAAICFAIFLILSAMFSGKADPTPLILLAVTLILPGVVIIVTVRQFEYLMWLGIYILALPIWNFVLPMYAFWHFDDFSWGETRKVNGDTTGGDHSNSGSGMHDPTNIPSRTLKEWLTLDGKFNDGYHTPSVLLSSMGNQRNSSFLREMSSINPSPILAPQRPNSNSHTQIPVGNTQPQLSRQSRNSYSQRRSGTQPRLSFPSSAQLSDLREPGPVSASPVPYTESHQPSPQHLTFPQQPYQQQNQQQSKPLFEPQYPSTLPLRPPRARQTTPSPRYSTNLADQHTVPADRAAEPAWLRPATTLDQTFALYPTQALEYAHAQGHQGGYATFSGYHGGTPGTGAAPPAIPANVIPPTSYTQHADLRLSQPSNPPVWSLWDTAAAISRPVSSLFSTTPGRPVKKGPLPAVPVQDLENNDTRPGGSHFGHFGGRESAPTAPGGKQNEDGAETVKPKAHNPRRGRGRGPSAIELAQEWDGEQTVRAKKANPRSALGN